MVGSQQNGMQSVTVFINAYNLINLYSPVHPEISSIHLLFCLLPDLFSLTTILQKLFFFS